MRCIEITMGTDYYPTSGTININMRCIEIGNIGVTTATAMRLTLTWDVLKYA